MYHCQQSQITGFQNLKWNVFFELTVCPLSVLTVEASKIVMQYVAAVSGKGWEVDRVKEQLLQSNPVLEGVCLLLYFFVHLFLRTFFL